MSYQLIGQSKPRGLDEEIKEGIELVGWLKKMLIFNEYFLKKFRKFYKNF